LVALVPGAELRGVKARHLADTLLGLGNAIFGILVLEAFFGVLVADGDVNTALLTRKGARGDARFRQRVPLVPTVLRNLVELLLSQHLTAVDRDAFEVDIVDFDGLFGKSKDQVRK